MLTSGWIMSGHETKLVVTSTSSSRSGHVETKSKLVRPKVYSKVTSGRVLLQGPFRPSLVAQMKNKGEPKRKRFDSPKSHSLLDSGARSRSPTPKRNHPSQDRKCKVNFQEKADIKFALNLSNTTEQQVRKFTAKPAPSKWSSLTGHKKSEINIQKRVADLEATIDRLQKEMKNGQNVLKSTEENNTELESKVEVLEESLKEKEKQHAVAVDETTKELLLNNKTLEEKLDQCERMLEKCSIDPVTFKERSILPEDRAEVEENRQSAKDKVLALSVDEMNEKMTEYTKQLEELIKDRASSTQTS